MKKKYKSTMYACFIGYIVQAIVNNFVTLLFVTFQNSYQIPLSKITLLITINFLIQLIIDLASAGFIDRLGYRFSVILAHICSAAGLIALTILPEVFADPYTGILVAVAIALPIGIISATRQYSMIDNVGMIAALLGVATPNFWLGLMLIIVFSLNLGWLPSGGMGSWKNYIMPAITLGTGDAALICRMTRSSMLEVIRQDYIRTARAKGVPEKMVIRKHALKNALIPVVTVIGLQFGSLLGGATLTETVFAWPGVGRLLVDSIKSKDAPLVLGGVIMMTITFSIVNLCVDILYAFIDPRIKAQYKKK